MAKSRKICYNEWGFSLYTKADVDYDDRYRQDCTADHKYLRAAPGNRRGFPTDEGFLETGSMIQYIREYNDSNILYHR